MKHYVPMTTKQSPRTIFINPDMVVAIEEINASNGDVYARVYLLGGEYFEVAHTAEGVIHMLDADIH